MIFGDGPFAEVVYFYLTYDSEYEIVAFTVDQKYLNRKEIFGLPVISFERLPTKFPPKKYFMFVAVGYQKMNKTRAKICEKVKKQNYKLISYVNSKAITWKDLKLGENCFIFENNVIQPFVKIGNDVIMWSGNHIGHHSSIGDHCFISSHVVISGNVNVGSNCFLGVNSTIRDGINIGSECVIGAGSLILEDTKEKEVYSAEKGKLLPIKSDNLTHL
ncbi:acetyltransferase [Candidatus Nitrosotenuis uzonensis]|uniref:Transferase n=1 Tax=Candidatus Nitrosotenuis uzonensis TaxID=1407055 RepID=V6AUB6_9ARCH|nr:acetyltransferase [Candidatus Nitrosotenuis uzonensis]CDI06456.1 putative Transferase [Candidatus Nitrosotenuis uzonensis]